MSTRSFMLWEKKLVLDLFILLSNAMENLKNLMSVKEKECEGNTYLTL